MNRRFMLVSVLVWAHSLALDSPRDARILQYEFDNIGTGPYHFRFETSDGTRREEQGILTNENTEAEAVVVRGSYAYTDGTGKVYTVRYTADENGFHPEGDHIKVPPFVPWIKHQHHHDEAGSSVYLPSTPKPPVHYIPSTTPAIKPEYVPTSPRPVQIYPSAGGNLGESAAYLPSTPAPTAGLFDQLDTRFQNSPRNFINNGPNLNIQAINDL